MQNPHGDQRVWRTHVEQRAHGKRILHDNEELASLALTHLIGTSYHYACVTDFDRRLHDDTSLQG
jgi:hypothetical protein